MARVADYTCLQDQEVELTLNPAGDASVKLTFTPPQNAAVDRFFCSPILMFLVRAEGAVVRLRVELNDNAVLFDDRDIQINVTSRTYHEIINRDYLKPGVENSLQFTVLSGGNNAKVILSDVIVWFQRSADS